MSTSEFRDNARKAGLLYLGIIVLGVSSETMLRGGLIDWSDGAATTAAIAASSGRFRLSIAFDLGMAVFDVSLAVLFFVMLRPVHAARALMAMVFRLMQAAIIAGNVMMLYAADTAAQTGADALPFLARHAVGYDLGLVFFGINCLIMAWLLARTGFTPRLLGWGVAAAGFVYLVGSLSRFVAPDFNAMFQPAYVIPLAAESALCLWLLFSPALRRRA